MTDALKMFAEMRIVANVGGNDCRRSVIDEKEEMIARVKEANMIQENWFGWKLDERITGGDGRGDMG